MIGVLAAIAAGIAAMLHVYIFALESWKWSEPRVWRRFGVKDQAAADIVKPMAYNQGFYNMFLAVGVIIGIGVLAAGEPGDATFAAGRAVALFSLGSMVAASLVLLRTGMKYILPAAVQGTMPLIAFVLLVLA